MDRPPYIPTRSPYDHITSQSHSQQSHSSRPSSSARESPSASTSFWDRANSLLAAQGGSAGYAFDRERSREQSRELGDRRDRERPAAGSGYTASGGAGNSGGHRRDDHPVRGLREIRPAPAFREPTSGSAPASATWSHVASARQTEPVSRSLDRPSGSGSGSSSHSHSRAASNIGITASGTNGRATNASHPPAAHDRAAGSSRHGSYTPQAVSPADHGSGRTGGGQVAKVERADDGAGDVYEESSRGPQRSRAGCLVCRERKVKCDEVRPVCGKCAIKSRQCVWPDPEAKGNKKRRASTLTDTRTAAGRTETTPRITPTSRSQAGVTSRSNTPRVDKHERFDLPQPHTMAASASDMELEPNPLASLLGAAQASAMHDTRYSGTGHRNVDGRNRQRELDYLDSLGSSGTGTISPSRLHIHHSRSGGQAQQRSSSPSIELRPTGSASLAQILDTHESLNSYPDTETRNGTNRGQAESEQGRGSMGLLERHALAHDTTNNRSYGNGRSMASSILDSGIDRASPSKRFKGSSGYDLSALLEEANAGTGSSGRNSRPPDIAVNGHDHEAAMRLRLDSTLQSSISYEPPTTITPSSLHRPSLPDFSGVNTSAPLQNASGGGPYQSTMSSFDAHMPPPSNGLGSGQGIHPLPPLYPDGNHQPSVAGIATNGVNGINGINGSINGLPSESRPIPDLSNPVQDPLLDSLELGPDWFAMLFGNTDDLVSQPPPAFPPLHFQPPPLPPPTRFYVPPDFLPKHSVHDADDIRGGGLARVLVRDDKRAEMMADPAFLAPYFPNLDERIVMRHYLLHTVNIIIAFQCPRKPWNPWVTIHAPLAFNHLPGTQILNIRTNPAADALRAAMLAVGGVHLRSKHNSADQKGAWAIVRAGKAQVLSLVRKSIDAQQATNMPMDKGDVEMILAALLSCTIASSLAADESWHELLTSVLSLVDRLGGAPALLRETRVEGDTKPQQMSAFRFLLEQLAIRDVFGCMTTELAPSMLNVAFSPWFFEAEGWSRGDDEWESIERMFGISRGMVDVIARACTLISQVRKNGITISEDLSAESGWGTHTKDFTLRLPQRVINRIDQSTSADGNGDNGKSEGRRTTVAISPHAIIIPTPPRTASPSISLPSILDKAQSTSRTFQPRAISPTTALLQADVLHAANGLIAELSVWDKSSNFTPFHPRTQYGNHTYRHAIKIRLLREVFMVPMDDARVQDSVRAIVELTVELLAQYGRITWLTWPIVLAAFNMLPDDPQRKVALTLLNEFTYHACFDLTAARKMLCEYWEEEDVATTPGQVVKRQRVRPFLD